MITAMAPRKSGGLIAATDKGVEFWDPATDERSPFVTPETGLPGNRSNDGKCDRSGRFWLGTMANNLNADGTGKDLPGTTGNLYRIDADGSVAKMDGPFGVSNTFAWSPDNRTMYFADSLKGIYAYDFDLASGTIANRRLFAATDDPADGVPDGSTIDADGFVWNCRWDGGGIIRWAPDGTIDRRIALPSSRVTSAIFGGENLETLYVTTARFDMSEGELAAQPLAGGIFAIDAGVRGIAEVPFAG
jgi:sugar lactone lactonase YvrE